MEFEVVFKPLARHEVAEAYEWYQQPHIGMGDDFLDELERTHICILELKMRCGARI